MLSSLLACTDQQQTLTNLTHNQQLWQASRPLRYRYHLHIRCFCPDLSRPVVIEVNHDGTLVREEVSGNIVDGRPFAAYDTIDELFLIIQKASERKVNAISVTYEPHFGYPTHIRIDDSVLSRDDTLDITVSTLEPAP
jgi:hypothetical protein